MLAEQVPDCIGLYGAAMLGALFASCSTAQSSGLRNDTAGPSKARCAESQPGCKRSTT